MKYKYVDLGFLNTKTIVTVTLSNAANVHLMDDWNYQRYSRGDDFYAQGGYVKSGSISFPVKTSGKRFLTVDLGGAEGKLRFSYKVEEEAHYYEPKSWQIQSDNDDYKVKVSSRYLEKNPKYGTPDMKRTDYLIFDKKTGKHKHLSIGEDPETDIKDWHEWR